MSNEIKALHIAGLFFGRKQKRLVGCFCFPPGVLVRLFGSFFILLLIGCATPVVVEYERDRFGVPYPVVDGVPYELTEAERKKIAEAFLDKYCR